MTTSYSLFVGVDIAAKSVAIEWQHPETGLIQQMDIEQSKRDYKRLVQKLTKQQSASNLEREGWWRGFNTHFSQFNDALEGYTKNIYNSDSPSDLSKAIDEARHNGADMNWGTEHKDYHDYLASPVLITAKRTAVFKVFGGTNPVARNLGYSRNRE